MESQLMYRELNLASEWLTEARPRLAAALRHSDVTFLWSHKSRLGQQEILSSHYDDYFVTSVIASEIDHDSLRNFGCAKFAIVSAALASIDTHEDASFRKASAWLLSGKSCNRFDEALVGRTPITGRQFTQHDSLVLTEIIERYGESDSLLEEFWLTARDDKDEQRPLWDLVTDFFEARTGAAKKTLDNILANVARLSLIHI